MANGLIRDYYSPDNFRYEKRIVDEKDIDYLLNEKVFPMYLNLEENYLLFLEVNSVINHNSVAFFYETLQSNATYIIRIDLEVFCAFIKSCENHFDEKKVLFVHHPGRCGSTLLHKILGSHPQVESFSEDLIINNLFLENNIKWESFDNFFRSFVSFLYYKHIGKEKKILSFKMTGSSMHYIDHLLKILPRAKHIYLTGDPIKISESFANLITNIKIRKIKVGYLLKWLGGFTFKTKILWERKNVYGCSMGKYLGLGVIDEKVKQVHSANFLEQTILRVLITDKIFKYFNRSNLVQIRYDDIIQKTKLFNLLTAFLELDSNNSFDRSVYQKHSQSNSIGKISIEKNYRLSMKTKQKLISFQTYVEQII